MNSLTSLLDRLDHLVKESENDEHSTPYRLGLACQLEIELSDNARPLIDAMREMQRGLNEIIDWDDQRDSEMQDPTLSNMAVETLERVGKIFGDKEKG